MGTHHTSILLLFVACHCSAVRQDFDADLQNGIERLYQDLTFGLTVNGKDYVPFEITNNLESIRWYLSGGHNYKLSSLEVRKIYVIFLSFFRH